MTNVIEVQNKIDLNTKLAEAGDGIVIIEFCANWCGPCNILAPDLNKLAAEYADMLIIHVLMEENENTELNEEYNITHFPTIKIVRSKQVFYTIVGSNFSPIEAAINDLKKTKC